MARSYVYGTVRDTARRSIHVVRVQNELLDPTQIDHLAARVREKLEARGEVIADVVVVQGDRKETLRLSGTPYAVNQVRAAMFSAAIRWSPFNID